MRAQPARRNRSDWARDAGWGRIAETLAFFEFIQAELSAMLERWRARKADFGVLQFEAGGFLGESKKEKSWRCER